MSFIKSLEDIDEILAEHLPKMLVNIILNPSGPGALSAPRENTTIRISSSANNSSRRLRFHWIV